MRFIFYIFLILLVPFVFGSEIKTFEINDFQIEKINGYNLIFFPVANHLRYEQYYTEMPMAVLEYNYSPDKVISNVSVKSYSGPKDVEINLPEVSEDVDGTTLYRENSCAVNENPPDLDYSVIYSERAYLIVNFYPLEIVDCENDLYRYYENYEIEIEFLDGNEFSVKSLDDVIVEQNVTFELEFEEVPNGVVEVETQAYEFYHYEVNEKKVEIEVPVPLLAFQEFVFYYYEEKSDEEYELNSVNFYGEDLRWGDFDFRVLNGEDNNTLELAIEVINILNKEIPLEIEIYSVDSDLNVYENRNLTIYAKPHRYMYYTNFSISNESKFNDIVMFATYDNFSLTVGHNTLVRFDKEDTLDGFPKTPGEELYETAIDIALEGDFSEDKIESEDGQMGVYAIVFTILFILILFGIVFYGIKLLRED